MVTKAENTQWGENLFLDNSQFINEFMWNKSDGALNNVWISIWKCELNVLITIDDLFVFYSMFLPPSIWVYDEANFHFDWIAQTAHQLQSMEKFLDLWHLFRTTLPMKLSVLFEVSLIFFWRKHAWLSSVESSLL